jgi:hypothetical protein
VQLYREFDFDNADTSGFVTFDASNENAYWIDSNGRDLGVLLYIFERNLHHYHIGAIYFEPLPRITQRNQTGAPQQQQRQLVYEAKKAEPSPFFHRVDRTILAVYEVYAKQQMTILNDTIREDFMYLNKLREGAEVYISSSSLGWCIIVIIVFDIFTSCF